MTEIATRIAALKAQLHEMTGGSPAVIPFDLQRRQDIELTYTSNAIEGNTLTYGETADLIEHGYVAAGKTFKEHQEADDHYNALRWMRRQVDNGALPSEEFVLELHRLTLRASRPDIAGFYARHQRRIGGGSGVVFPNYAKVPDLMRALGEHIARADDSPRAAFDAHFRLVTIHPFDDGNGRTARLLTNFMLLSRGYAPVTVRPEDRDEYRNTLEQAQLAEDYGAPAFQAFMHRRLEAALQEIVADFGQGRRHGVEEERIRADRGDDPSGTRPPSAAQIAHLAQLRGRGR